jgi:hypothetical protein
MAITKGTALKLLLGGPVPTVFIVIISLSSFDLKTSFFKQRIKSRNHCRPIIGLRIAGPFREDLTVALLLVQIHHTAMTERTINPKQYTCAGVNPPAVQAWGSWYLKNSKRNRHEEESARHDKKRSPFPAPNGYFFSIQIRTRKPRRPQIEA